MHDSGARICQSSLCAISCCVCPLLVFWDGRITFVSGISKKKSKRVTFVTKMVIIVFIYGKVEAGVVK